MLEFSAAKGSLQTNKDSMDVYKDFHYTANEISSAEVRNIDGKATNVNYTFEAGKQRGVISSSITSIEVDEDNEFEYSKANLSLELLKWKVKKWKRNSMMRWLKLTA